MPLSITRPSNCVKTGRCVASNSSVRYTRPGTGRRSGGSRSSIDRTCTGLVCVRITRCRATGSTKNVSCICRAGWSTSKFSASKLNHSCSSSGPSAISHPCRRRCRTPLLQEGDRMTRTDTRTLRQRRDVDALRLPAGLRSRPRRARPRGRRTPGSRAPAPARRACRKRPCSRGDVCAAGVESRQRRLLPGVRGAGGLQVGRGRGGGDGRECGIDGGGDGLGGDLRCVRHENRVYRRAGLLPRPS